MVCEGVLRVLNGGVNRFTALPAVAAKKSPEGIKRIAPLLVEVPLLNVAAGVLEAVSGSVKNVKPPPKAPATRFPLASRPMLTMLFPGSVKFGVELAVRGRLYSRMPPAGLSFPTYKCWAETAWLTNTTNPRQTRSLCLRKPVRSIPSSNDFYAAMMEASLVRGCQPRHDRDHKEGSLARAFSRYRVGAQGRTRTGTGFPTRPSNVRVYQFRHLGKREKSCAADYFLAGAVGAAGAEPLMTEPRGRPWRMASVREAMTKATKNPGVSLCRSVVAPSAPKPVFEPPPPNAPARSAPFPC